MQLADSAGRARGNDPQLFLLRLPARRRDAGSGLADRPPDLYQAWRRRSLRHVVSGASRTDLPDDDVLRAAGTLTAISIRVTKAASSVTAKGTAPTWSFSVSASFLFKTGMQTMEKVQNELNALRATIRLLRESL